MRRARIGGQLARALRLRPARSARRRHAADARHLVLERRYSPAGSTSGWRAHAVERCIARAPAATPAPARARGGRARRHLDRFCRATAATNAPPARSTHRRRHAFSVSSIAPRWRDIAQLSGLHGSPRRRRRSGIRAAFSRTGCTRSPRGWRRSRRRTRCARSRCRFPRSAPGTRKRSPGSPRLGEREREIQVGDHQSSTTSTSAPLLESDSRSASM